MTGVTDGGEQVTFIVRPANPRTWSTDKKIYNSSVGSALSTTMKPGELYWSLVETVWDTVSIYEGEGVFLKQYEAAPTTSRTLFAAHWCQSEVRNGGLHQFFSNSTGILAPEAVSAFQRIGMPKTAAIVLKAMSWFGTTYPRDRKVRNEKLGKHEVQHPEDWNPFEQLDSAFFDLIDNETGGFDIAADTYAEKCG